MEGVGLGSLKVEINDDYVVSIMVLPQHVAEGALRDVAELVCRINYGMPFGKFDLDFSGGELRYILVLSSAELLDNPKVKAEWVTMAPGMMIRKWGPAIIKVLLGASTPEKEYAEANAKDDDDDDDDDNDTCEVS